jgi:hypothetical protein
MLYTFSATDAKPSQLCSSICAIYLAILVAIGIANGEARNTILVDLGVRGIQERKWGIAALLGVIARLKKLESGTGRSSLDVVLKSDVQWEIWRRVDGAAALAVIAGHESVLEDPVGAAGWGLETLSCAVAGGVDAVFKEEVLFGYDAGNINTGVVANTSTVFGGGYKTRELVLGDLALADGIRVKGITAGEDVDVGIIVIVIIAEAERTGESGGSKNEGGENGSCCKMHFGL